jgi:hypothetical protein
MNKLLDFTFIVLVTSLSISFRATFSDCMKLGHLVKAVFFINSCWPLIKDWNIVIIINPFQYLTHIFLFPEFKFNKLNFLNQLCFFLNVSKQHLILY